MLILQKDLWTHRFSFIWTSSFILTVAQLITSLLIDACSQALYGTMNSSFDFFAITRVNKCRKIKVLTILHSQNCGLQGKPDGWK